MRKLRIAFLGILLGLGLSACGQTENPSGTGSSESVLSDKSSETIPSNKSETVSDNGGSGASSEKNSDRTTGDQHVLIAYFTVPEDVKTSDNDAVAGASIVVKDSKKMGNTEYVAGLVQKTIGGDLFRIETKDAYPLEHDTLVDQAAEEQEKDLRPELSSHVENFEQYDTVILGYPNWWGDLPMPVYSFLEEYDFGRKTIIPFVTHGGSGFSATRDTISKLQPDASVSDHTLSLSREDVAAGEDDVKAWAESLGIK
ncbi:MAG: flavodoxin [Eubacterium sp.]|nr:flavodoxin [Eubacterium sp.]